VEDVFPPISSEAAQLMARAGQQRGCGGGRASSVSGKAWVNQILESNPVPVIWVTNRIEQIDPAFRRRFLPPGAQVTRRPARASLVRRALDGVAVSDAFVAR
jgi:hypothetical protein